MGLVNSALSSQSILPMGPKPKVIESAPIETLQTPEKPIQSKESFDAARLTQVGKGEQVVNASQTSQQIKQGIDQADSGHLLEQSQTLLQSSVVSEEFGLTIPKAPPLPPPPKPSPFKPSSGSSAITADMLVAARQKLKTVSQHQVLNLGDLSTGSTAKESTVSRKLGSEVGGVPLDRDTLPSADGTIDIVGHSSDGGMTIEGRNPQQLAQLLKDQYGLQQIQTIHLVSCKSEAFKAEFKQALADLGVTVGNVEAAKGNVAVDRATGKTLDAAVVGDLDKISGHDGTLDPIQNAQFMICNGNFVGANQIIVELAQNGRWGDIQDLGQYAVAQGQHNFATTLATNLVSNNCLDEASAITASLGNAGNWGAVQTIGEHAVAQGQHNFATTLATNLVSNNCLDEASAITASLGNAGNWGAVQTIGEHAIEQNQDNFAGRLCINLIDANCFTEAMNLVDKFEQQGNENALVQIINKFTESGSYKLACDVHLTLCKVKAENRGCWDEDFEATFDAIRNNPKNKSGQTKLDFIANLYEGQVASNKKSRKPDSFNILFGATLVDFRSTVTQTERNIIDFCLGSRKQKPGGSSLGSLDVSGEKVVGRPSFASDTQVFMPVRAGQHRRHIMAWHNIRDIGSKVLAKGSVDDLQTLLKQAPVKLTTEVSRLLKVDDIRNSDNHNALLTGVLFIMNSNPNNLWPGDGRTNSAIANAWSNVNKALNRAGDNLPALQKLQSNYAQASQLASNPYRQAQAIAAEIIQHGIDNDDSPANIRIRVLECIAGLEIDTLGSSKGQTSNIFAHQIDFIDTAKVAYRWLLNPDSEPAPTLEQMSIFMNYPPGYNLHNIDDTKYQDLQVNDSPQFIPLGVSQASISQFQIEGGQTACTAMAMRGISYAFSLAQDEHPQQDGLEQTLQDGTTVFQQMRQSAQEMGYDMHYFHPSEIPDQSIQEAGLQRGNTVTITNDETNIRDRVGELLDPTNVHNQNPLGLSLVLGGATVSISRVNDRFFVYDSHGFQGVSQNAFMQEFTNLGDAIDLIQNMVQERVGNNQDASITLFRPNY